jgi:lipoyl(octanoyl) transferase
MTPELWCARPGLVPYVEASELQRSLGEARRAGEIPDVLLLLEHPPVYTRGRRSEAAELPMGEDWYRAQGIEVRDTDRGGRVTYHGPGQLVGYPIVDLAELPGRGPGRIDVVAYVRAMERVMIGSLDALGVRAGVIDGLTGVWAGPVGAATDAAAAAPSVVRGELRKIGSIGVHVSRGIGSHGFAVNVNNDLQPFEWVVPCGIDGCRMTSIGRELGAEQPMDAVMDVFAERFARVYGHRLRPVDPARLPAASPAPAGAV